MTDFDLDGIKKIDRKRKSKTRNIQSTVNEETFRELSLLSMDTNTSKKEIIRYAVLNLLKEEGYLEGDG